VVKGITSAAGIPEVTADEKDPAMLALKVRALEIENQELQKVINDNVDSVRQAFVHVDMHTHVIQRVLHQLVQGDFNPGDQLNLQSYYEEYQWLYEKSPQETVEHALVAWAHGKSVDSAVGAALRVRDKQENETPASEQSAESDGYTTEHFGGDYGKDSNEQVEAASQKGG
jgi:hypothetical protein